MLTVETGETPSTGGGLPVPMRQTTQGTTAASAATGGGNPMKRQDVVRMKNHTEAVRACVTEWYFEYTERLNALDNEYSTATDERREKIEQETDALEDRWSVVVDIMDGLRTATKNLSRIVEDMDNGEW